MVGLCRPKVGSVLQLWGSLTAVMLNCRISAERHEVKMRKKSLAQAEAGGPLHCGCR